MKTAVFILIFAACSFAATDPTKPAIQVFMFADREAPPRSWVPISCDGTVVAKIKQGKFFTINLTPGKHVFSQGDGIPLFVDIHKGEQLFIQLERQTRADASGKSDVTALVEVDPTWARKILAYLTYIDTDKRFSPAVLMEDPTVSSRPQLKQRDARE